MSIIEVAPSGRSSCRGCKKKIAKGEHRYVEERQGQGDWEYRSLWHLGCAVDRRFEGASRVLANASELPEDQRRRLHCQALLHRCKQRGETVETAPWLANDEDGWAHLVCELASGRFAVITDLDGEWTVAIEGTRDDALAVLPEPLFEFAALAIGGKPPSRRTVAAALRKMRRKRTTKTRAKRKALGSARRAATAEAKKRGVPVADLKKGARVRIVGDVRSTRGASGQGKLATIFWTGYTKEGLEKRVGMKGDNGAKYWANLADVEPAVRTVRRTGGKKTIPKA